MSVRVHQGIRRRTACSFVERKEPPCNPAASPMSRTATLDRILAGGLVAVVRAPDSAGLVDVMRALADGGVTAAEVTMTVPNALDVFRSAKAALGNRVVLGVGTV